MGLDPLIEEAVIEFPKKISLKQAEDLIRAIVQGNEYDITYKVTQSKKAGDRFKLSDSGLSVRATSVNGTIFQKLGRSLSFEFSPENHNLFSGIRFDVFPYEHLNQIHSDEQQTMRFVRQRADYYFSKKQG